MSCHVYANGRSIACKAASGKIIAAAPDPCMSPPPPPAGPAPLPYPNMGKDSNTADGSDSVKIKNKPVILKDKSYISKSNGNEAATKSFGMGLISHQIQGKIHFASWSMDVKFEGKNVPRHLDRTTHNEQ